MTMNLIKEIYTIFNNRDRIKVLLIDEFKSSKIKIHTKENKISKHEASALILALREGIEVNQMNYFQIIKQTLPKSNIKQNFNDNTENNNDFILTLREAAEKILKGELSLTESMKLINNQLY